MSRLELRRRINRSRRNIGSIALRICAAGLLLAIGCATLSPRATTNTEPAVRAAMANFLDALNALDVDRMDAAFTDDVTAFVPTAQAEEAVGRAAVTRIFRVFADRIRATTPRLNLVPEDERVTASSTLGVVTFQIREAAPPIMHRRTFVFRRVGDRWLIGHFHASDLAPPGR
jgi:ketosteroid isomerase-like protein